ncbi:DUF2066 domain-containing protein [Roseospira marina]|uniref:DUF2066 domain-containing protein n=1 Tax=Roseospira marina TaxID=140057 RepID=UPI0014797571|nr:DUF2066 domain-containing protein [Roseospira marina]MBB4313460.1 hypothetical protein [Roseospira marina]MBB5086622.1 hypothetical protein [Roseospira marina]
MGTVVRLWLAVALVTVLGVVPGAVSALAQSAGEDGAYTARDVPIEATAGDPAQARQQAVAAGQVTAFQAMLRRITDPADQGRLPQPSADDVRRMVETYSLADERTTNTSYRARITVRYDGDAVRDLLQRNGIGYAASASQPVVVLPVYQAGPDRAPVLWEDTNPWLSAWRARDSENVLMPIDVPTGDLRDVTSVTAEEALEPDSEALARVLDRYGRAQALIAQAVRTGPDTLALSINYGSPRAMARTATTTLDRAAGESDAAFLIRAADAIASRMESDWRGATMISTGTAREVTALATLEGFGDWVAIRQALERSPMIRDHAVRAMTRDRAQLSLTVLGDAARVNAALEAEGLTVREHGAYWIISRIGGPSVPADPAAQPYPSSGPAPSGVFGGGPVSQ